MLFVQWPGAIRDNTNLYRIGFWTCVNAAAYITALCLVFIARGSLDENN